MSFGKKLYGWRKAKGLTQQELADAAGVNVSYISNLERDFSPTAKGGKPQPSNSLVDKFAKILEIDLNEARLAAGYAPTDDKSARVPVPILDAIGREGTLTENDTILVANFIETLKEKNKELEKKE